MKELSKEEQRIVRLVKACLRKNGAVPTYYEIGQQVKQKTSIVFKHMEELKAAGIDLSTKRK